MFKCSYIYVTTLNLSFAMWPIMQAQRINVIMTVKVLPWSFKSGQVNSSSLLYTYTSIKLIRTEATIMLQKLAFPSTAETMIVIISVNILASSVKSSELRL